MQKLRLVFYFNLLYQVCKCLVGVKNEWLYIMYVRIKTSMQLTIGLAIYTELQL